MKITKDVQSSFQLLATQTEKINFQNDFLTLPEDEIKTSVDCEYEILSVEQDEDKLYGFLELTVKVTAKSTEQSQRLSLTLCLIGGFTENADVSEEDFRRMLKINGCASLYSIARAQVLSLVSQSVMQGQILLPMTNFFKLKEKKDRKNNKE